MADGCDRDLPAYIPSEAATALVAGSHQRNSFDVLRLVDHLAYRLRVPPPRWPPLRLPVDLSYGLYLTSFPVQQTLIMVFPALHPLQLAASSLAICTGLAWMLWTFVEQPAKRLRAPLIAWFGEPGALAPRPAP